MSGRRMTLRQRIEARIAKRCDDAFLTREFRDLAGERQVLRALRELTEEGKLIRLGYGAYGRAEISPLTNQPMLAGDGFGAVSREVLDKLKIRWEPTTAERDYNEGRSTQVPMTPRVRLRGSRFSRKLRYKTMELTVER
ncbi:conjugal transfer protein [Acidisphaera sp. S103]|uniref:conjugal transfer protein n=1 Tax=Acidisphaera sp. S103 TaxID=1747223 RepID=UPI00131CE8A2|nr:conjugal transfer protein [Acidisphaera sp. S103]